MRLLLPVALALVVAVPLGRATTAPSTVVPVTVALNPTSVTLSRSEAARGNVVEFRVRNATGSHRMFSVADRTISIPAMTTRRVAIFFNARGRYRYSSRTASGRTIHGIFRIV